MNVSLLSNAKFPISQVADKINVQTKAAKLFYTYSEQNVAE